MQLTKRIVSKYTNSCVILEQFFDAEIRRLSKLMNEIIDSNDRKLGQPRSSGFLFNGDYYRREEKQLPNSADRVPLHDDLLPAMLDFLDQQSKALADIHLVNQMVFRIIRDCVTNQDLRDALPDNLFNLFPEFNAIPRTREEAYTIKDDEMAYRQYTEKVKPLLDYYAATALVF